jgi:MFS family permease
MSPPTPDSATDRDVTVTPQNGYLGVEKTAQDVSEQTSISGTIDVEEKASEVVVSEVSPRDVHGVRWAIVVVAILSSVFLFALDNTIVAVVQPAIVAEFSEIQKLPWLAAAFTLSAAAMNLIFGKIYGQFNAKWTYLISTFLFELGSAICGAAPSMNALIIGRAVCGVGGMGMYIGVMTLLSVTTTITERPMYIGSTGLMWGIGTVLGPIVGGAFVESSAGWRWAFYINLCIGGLFAPVYLFMLPTYDPRPQVSFVKRAKEMDFVGTIIIIGAMVSGVMAISFGGVLYAWNSGQIIACFVLSAVLFGVFAVQQEKAIFTTVAHRIFPVQFLRSRTMLILFAQTSAAASGIVIPLYMMPLYFQFTRGDSALEAGVRLLPYVALMVFACIVNGAVLSMYGLYMPWYVVGGVLFTIGSALMYTVGVSTSVSAVYGYSVLLGVGVGIFVQASFAVAQGIVKEDEIPSAVGFITCGQITGITISISVANSIFLNKAETGISELLPQVPITDIQAAIAGVGSKFVQSLPEDVKEAVLEVIVTSLSKTYIMNIVAGALSVILAVFMKRERLFLAVAGAA